MIQRIYKLLTKPNLDIRAFPMAQQVKNPPAMQEAQEMQVWSLVGYVPWSHKELDMTEHLNTHTHNLDIVHEWPIDKIMTWTTNERS